MRNNIIKVGAIAGLLSFGLAACSSSSQAVQDKGVAANSRVSNSQAARAFGSVIGKDEESRLLEITHSPVPEADWPIMQMDFYVERDIDMTSYRVGDAVEFIFTYGSDKSPTIVAIRRTTAKELIGALWPHLRQRPDQTK